MEMQSSLSSEIPNIRGYKDLRLIRPQGGMSEIYRGTRTDTGQQVIIKLMPAPKNEQESLKFQRRFNQEMLIARLSANNHLLAATDHGDIPMHGSGEPRFYLVYPYIEYGSLADLLTVEKPWKTWELPHITDIIAQAAEGLFHLHKSGIVHQDVKPQNFLWMPSDSLRNPLRRIHVWLIDFGVAEPERKGKTRDIKGTIKYLAPEQLNGDIKYSIDQYALALMARLLLTGHEPPLLNESASGLLYTRPTELNPQRLLEPEIDAVILKALAPDPQNRFTSIIEFAEALQEAVLKQIQQNVHATISDPSLTLSEIQLANPFLGLVAPSLPQETFTQPPVLPVKPKEAIFLPPLNPPKPYQPPLPRDASEPRTAHRNKLAGPSLPAVPAHKWLTVKLPDTPRMLTWSPNGQELFCTFYHDLPLLINVKHSAEILPGFAHGHSACWSPDNRFIAISMNNENNPQADIRLCDRTTSKERYRLPFLHQPEPIRGLDWSARGLFAIWLGHALLIYDLSKIPTHKHLPDPSYSLPLGDDMYCDQLTTLRWSPNGEWLAAGSNNGQIVCWQPHTARYLKRQPLKKNIRSMSWSADGKILVIAFANKQVLFWNLETEHISPAELPENPRMVSISPQTGQIAIATEKTLFFFEHTGALAPTAMHPGQLYAAFSSDNKLATLDQYDRNELIIWQL
jgi:serine/threonine protein kinase